MMRSPLTSYVASLLQARFAPGYLAYPLGSTNVTQLHRRPDQATVARAGEFRESLLGKSNRMGLPGSLARNYTTERFRKLGAKERHRNSSQTAAAVTGHQ